MNNKYIWKCGACKREVECTDLKDRPNTVCDCGKDEETPVLRRQMALIKMPKK